MKKQNNFGKMIRKIISEMRARKCKPKQKKNIRHQEQSTKKRKKTTREKKVDNEKLKILKLCQGILEENGIIATIEKEVAIHFEIEDTKFTLQLTRHRPPKK